jgi:hypothetical protein
MKNDRHRRAAIGVVASYMHERSDRHRPSRDPGLEIVTKGRIEAIYAR